MTNLRRIFSRKRGPFGAVVAVCSVVAMASSLLTGCGGYGFTFRYRLAFAVTVNGETKSASSVIQMLYYGSDDVGASGMRGYSMTKGVAPIIDLGPYGMLAAALDMNVKEYATRRDKYGLKCQMPTTAASLPNAFDLKGKNPAKALSQLKGEKKELPENLYPAFIWFPAGEPFTKAQQICPEEFSRVIGARVALQSITIEAAPDAPLVETLQIKAPWLDEIRIDQHNSFHGSSSEFIPDLHGQLETGRITP